METVVVVEGGSRCKLTGKQAVPAKFSEFSVP